MGFARIAILVMGLMLSYIGSARALSSSGGVPSQRPLPRPPATLGFSVLSQALPGAVKYGAPYHFAPVLMNYPGTTGPCLYNFQVGDPELSINDAAQDFLKRFNYCYDDGYSDCTVSVSLYPPGDADVAEATLASGVHYGCHGYDDIIATGYSNNVGEGVNGGDGEGDEQSDAAPDVGDPIDASSGNKFLQQDDYLDTSWLTFRRFYNSSPAQASAAMGPQWRHSFDRSLVITGSPISTILMYRPDGSKETFTKVNGVWTNTLAYVDHLVENVDAQGVVTGYTVSIGANRHTETYGTAGRLLSVTDQTGQGITLTYSTTSTPVSVAPAAGLLLTVTDSKSRQLKFTYNSTSRVQQVTLPDNGTLTYTYDNENRLGGVQYPDTKVRQYFYGGDEQSAYLLGAIVDENGVQYAFTGYDSSGNAIASYFTNAPDSYVGITQTTYNSDGTSTIQYPLGHSATMGFSQVNGLNQIASVDQPCGPECGQQWKTRTYDSNGYPASYTDFKGNLTTTQYNAYGLLHIEVDGVGSPNQRATTTVWSGPLRQPLTRQVQDVHGNVVAANAWAYNFLGEMNARCEIDPAVPAAMSYSCVNTTVPPHGVRQWGYHYCGGVDTVQCPVVGLLLSVDGPRTDVSDVTTYAYYMLDGVNHHHGDLKSITDPLGHVTTYLIYDDAGRVTSMQDANGVVTNLTYTPRGWLNTRSVGGATTTLTYMPYGAVKTITDPDGVVTSYSYDDAHRLTDITDAQGNRIHYVLDAAGNKTSEQIINIAGNTVKSQSPTFNALGQITSIVDGLGNTVFSANYGDSYDANGKLHHSVDGLNYQQMLGYDALNRLQSTVKNYNGTDTTTSNTTSTYLKDPLDRLTAVGDPDGLNTTYTFDGLTNLTQQQSPDTGTSTDTFDAAGNRLVHTDAKGIVSTRSYDALDRLSGEVYTDTSLNAAYHYDEANTVTGCATSFPIGHLTRIVEVGVTTDFCYDGRGNITQKVQATASNTDTTVYTYSLANRLIGEITPDLTTLVYSFDNNGHISGVQVTPSGGTSASPTVVSNVTWMPFGPISSYTLGNGQSVTRTYDANYRLTDIVSAPFTLHVSRDVMGDINGIGNAPGATPVTESYIYDPLYRLKSITEAGGTPFESYTYNRTGDRLSKVTTGLAGGAYGYSTGTHQLSSIGGVAQANDADGNRTGSVIGGITYGFSYNGRNRLTLAQRGGQTVGTYSYNALGERISKIVTSPQALTERYAYDEATHIIGEYGATNRDYIWLGDIPVAVIDNSINGSVTTSVINYIVSDQLNTPRAIANNAGATIWQWAYQGNPFGEKQPTSTTGYQFNLRFPGQYFDAESNTNYNIFRNYEPVTGRYIQSDPIGLGGGTSTYGYAGGNPIKYFDLLGLDPAENVAPQQCGSGGTGECGPAMGDVVGAVVGLGVTGLTFLVPEAAVALVPVGVLVSYSAAQMSVDPNQAFPIYAIPNKG